MTPTAHAEEKPPLAKGKISNAALDVMRDKLSSCWSIPDSPNLDSLTVKVVIELKPDGSLAKAPRIQSPKPGKEFQDFANSAIRAIRKCAPFNMFSADYLENLGEIVVTFALSAIPPTSQQ
ncbi:cell envelope integrity protein TolA [Mesorhizobium sp. 1M-11]|uniref:cell envelope integrity protein TolA n=1 Tax=Mesorhizobium sp. 1M-11 TaxID=1529006 RepID=UPI00128FC2BB|nr:cell envelope integrity protein TolA [Mesorhizobium sp. 1M-11]